MIGSEETNAQTPESIFSIKNKEFKNLPASVEIPRDILASFQSLQTKTDQTGNEWSMYLHERNGRLGIDNIQQGKQFESEAFDVSDMTGFEGERENRMAMKMVLDVEEMVKRGAENPSLYVYGKELPVIAANTTLPDKVFFIAGAEFFSLVHTHPDSQTFSPQDFGFLAYQDLRPDGKPLMGTSIVISGGKIYMLTIPTDGVVDASDKGPFRKLTQMKKSFDLMEQYFNRHGEVNKEHLMEYTKMLSKRHNYGFYQGELTTGVLDRLV